MELRNWMTGWMAGEMGCGGWIRYSSPTRGSCLPQPGAPRSGGLESSPRPMMEKGGVNPDRAMHKEGQGGTKRGGQSGQGAGDKPETRQSINQSINPIHPDPSDPSDPSDGQKLIQADAKAPTTTFTRSAVTRKLVQ